MKNKKNLTLTLIALFLIFLLVKFAPADRFGYTKIIKIKDEKFGRYGSLIQKLDSQNFLLIAKNKVKDAGLIFNVKNNEFSKFNLPVKADYFARDIKIFGNKIYIDDAVPYGGRSPKDYFAIINKDTMQMDGLLPQYLVPSFKNETTIEFNFVPLNNDIQLIFSGIGNKFVIGKYISNTKKIEKLFEKKYETIGFRSNIKCVFIENNKVLIFANIKLKDVELNFDIEKYQPVYEYDYSKNQIKLIGKTLGKDLINVIKIYEKIVIAGDADSPVEIFDIKDGTSKILNIATNKKADYLIPIKYKNNQVAIIPVTEKRDYESSVLQGFPMVLFVVLFTPELSLFERIMYLCQIIITVVYFSVEYVILNYFIDNNICFINLETYKLTKGWKMPFDNFDAVESLDDGKIVILNKNKLAILNEWGK